jgi:oxygen-independent coproporphyrinogen-3 oxidase
MDARQHAGLFREFDTLYVGGGTPSVLDDASLKRLVQESIAPLPFTSDAERTIEVNPGDVTPDLAHLLASLGFNRVSVGIQSLDDRTLAFLGRRHDSATAVRAVGMLRDAGFANLGIDLIYGIPGQDRGDWLCNLEKAATLAPDHVSCYSLTFEDATPFGKAMDRGQMTAPDDDALADAFLDTSAFWVARGYDHYEVSNFARSDDLRSRHNSKYWRMVPYLGLGPSAHSYDGARRWWNPSSIASWRQRLEDGLDPADGSEEITAEMRRLETMALGLRTSNGVDESLLSAPGGHPDLANRLVREGLLVRKGSRIVPTSRGMLVADALARDLA